MKKTTFATSYKSEQEGKEIKCYTIKGENTSHIEELGQYRVKYFFNTTLGFVCWEYTLPNKEQVILELK